MKAAGLIPLAVVMVGGLGYGLCRVNGVDAHVKQLMLAGGAGLAGGLAGCLPLALAKGGVQATMAQAGLGGTVVHLMLTLVLGGVTWGMSRVEERASLLCWLTAFYWAVLVAMVIVAVAAVRSAKVESKAASGGGPGVAGSETE